MVCYELIQQEHPNERIALLKVNNWDYYFSDKCKKIFYEVYNSTNLIDSAKKDAFIRQLRETHYDVEELKLGVIRV